MKRMYYLTDNIDSCESIADDLHRAGIKDWNFHVLSRDEVGLRKRHIHSANYVHKLDIVRDAERGAMVGLVAAVLATLYLTSSNTFGVHASGMMYLAIFGFITMFGAWAGGMVGLSTENQKIARYHNEIQAGKYLILIDVKDEEENRVKQLMGSSHPEAVFQRVGSTFINPFKFTNSVTA